MGNDNYNINIDRIPAPDKYHQKTGIYRHYKGKEYIVIGVGQHSETQEICVIYIPLYDHQGCPFSFRPHEMFNGFVEIDGNKVKRFTYLGNYKD